MARILQVCNTEFYLRGFLWPLVEELRGRGHHVTCVTGLNSGEPRQLTSGIAIHHHAFPRLKSPVAFVQSARTLRRLIDRVQPDLVNSHNRNASCVARIAGVGRHWQHVYTAHGFYFHDNQSRLAREVAMGMERALGIFSPHVLSQSREDLDILRRRGSRLGRRSQWIGNGIDTQRFAPGRDRQTCETQLGLRHDRFRIVSVGRLVRGKGFQDLIRALKPVAARVPNVELVLVGGTIRADINPWESELRQLIESLGLSDRVLVTGLTDDVPAYLASADLYATASRREGISRALLEAMGAELPVVATRIRGAREVIEHGRNGLLFDPTDLRALVAHITSLAEDSTLRNRLAVRGRHTVLSNYQQSCYVTRQADALERHVGATCPTPAPATAVAARSTTAPARRRVAARTRAVSVPVHP